MAKELLIIAGPNGSGKTTFAKSFLRDYKYDFLNADEIAQEISEDGSRAGDITSGREYFKRLEKLKTKNKNIILESTLSGLFLKKLINDFRKKDYKVTIFYVLLNRAEVCIERIQERVRQGGHFVKNEDVIRRFRRSKINFWNFYKNMVDAWFMYNNSNVKPEEVAFGKGNELTIIQQDLFDQFLKNIK